MNIDVEAVRGYFDGLADKWDEICRHEPAKLEAIAVIAGIKPGGKVLDVACGTGVMFAPLMEAGAGEIVGVDLSPKMIQKAREKFKHKRIRLFASNIFDFHEAGFDAAVVYSAYPHFAGSEALAAHLYSLLKPGGRVTVAHSEAREVINARHTGGASAVSRELGKASDEAEVFAKFFDMDVIVDTEYAYVISGKKI